jgi:hypothetical protein
MRETAEPTKFLQNPCSARHPPTEETLCLADTCKTAGQLENCTQKSGFGLLLGT